MAYLQFALLHIPAVVIHGNSLSLEEFGRWYTPAHIMDGWSWKLRRQPDDEHDIQEAPEVSEPGHPGRTDRPQPPQQLTLF
jgi:hypothetical protein